MSPRENRPHEVETAPEKRLATRDQSTEAPRIPHLTAAEIAASRPAYVVVVKTVTDRRIRRLFLSLSAAEKAALRAQARGSAVSVELMRLVPYTVGPELHGAVSADA